MSCSHARLRSWVFQVNGEPAGMWSCLDCGHKFVPVNIAQEKDAARYRHLRANFASVGMGGIELIWDQPDPQDALDELIDFAMRAEQFPGVDIDAAHKA